MRRFPIFMVHVLGGNAYPQFLKGSTILLLLSQKHTNLPLQNLLNHSAGRTKYKFESELHSRAPANHSSRVRSITSPAAWSESTSIGEDLGSRLTDELDSPAINDSRIRRVSLFFVLGPVRLLDGPGDPSSLARFLSLVPDAPD